MSQTAAMVDALKRVLRARRVNYAQVARALSLSEATIKRLFAKNDLSLERFERVCELAGTSIAELARELDSHTGYLSRLTLEQEREIVGNPKLFLIAVCALNHLNLEQIVATYDMTKAECIQLLARLDRIRFLELLPGDRIRLKVARTFSWLPDGPIRRFFLDRAEREYFRSRFDATGEHIAVVNGMLSRASSERLIARLKRVAAEFAELHEDDKRLPLGERRPASLLLAVRPWELDAFHALRRRRRPG
ncbi:MAG TPA: helix-turn-helix transcriptional regulator [Burkholderiales bacterium]|nr:helix-turn-helix transcriptional regulator [Burkholderiales bacterium]